MFSLLSKIFCVFILIMHILFCCTHQKNVLQKEIKDWNFKVYLFTGEPSSWYTESLKMTCVRLCVVLSFFCQTERVWIVFRGVTSCQKSVKCLWSAQNSKNEWVGSILTCSKLAKWSSILNCSKSAKWQV